MKRFICIAAILSLPMCTPMGPHHGGYGIRGMAGGPGYVNGTPPGPHQPGAHMACDVDWDETCAAGTGPGPCCLQE